MTLMAVRPTLRYFTDLMNMRSNT